MLGTDAGRCARLDQQATHRLLVLRELGAHHLDRNLATEVEVRGAQHDAHAAFAEHGFDTVLARKHVAFAEVAAAQASPAKRARLGLVLGSG